MVDDPRVLWRIDAWDSLAGRAFLCRRLPDRDTDPQLDQPTVFVAPPFFQPEPLASRAPGLAASRGTFQAALFVEGGEAGFASLEDAIAFIRRGYNSHGPEFPGTPATPREGPEGRGGPGLALELPDMSYAHGFLQLDDAIAKCVMTNFVDAGANLVAGEEAKPVNWSLSDSDVLSHLHKMLTFAGKLLMMEMLRHFPYNKSPDDFVAWSGPAHSLAKQLIRLGLWKDIVQYLAATLQIRTPRELAKHFEIGLPDHWFQDESQFSEIGEWRFGREVSRIVESLFVPSEDSMGLWLFDAAGGGGTDVYRELSLFPLPEIIARRYRIGDIDPTVLTLMSTWFGHPLHGADDMLLDRALLLFGGACAVIGPLQCETLTYRPHWIVENAGLQQAFNRRLGQETWSWIGRQLPDRVFHRELENVLKSIPRIWSEAAMAGGAEPVRAETIEDPNPDEIAILRKELDEVITDLEQETQVVQQSWA